MKFKIDVLSGIIFGMNINIANILKIKHIVDEKYTSKDVNIKLYQSKSKNDCYGIDISEIDNFNKYLADLST